MQVLRSYVMELPNGDMQAIVKAALRNWDAITYKEDKEDIVSKADN